jgi:hypothetical protein
MLSLGSHRDFTPLLPRIIIFGPPRSPSHALDGTHEKQRN